MEIQIRELLEDVQVRKSLRAASSPNEAAQVLVVAAGRKGHRLTVEGVLQAMSSTAQVDAGDLSAEELMAVGGASRCTMTGTFRPKCPEY